MKALFLAVVLAASPVAAMAQEPDGKPALTFSFGAQPQDSLLRGGPLPSGSFLPQAIRPFQPGTGGRSEAEPELVGRFALGDWSLATTFARSGDEGYRSGSEYGATLGYTFRDGIGSLTVGPSVSFVETQGRAGEHGFSGVSGTGLSTSFSLTLTPRLTFQGTAEVLRNSEEWSLQRNGEPGRFMGGAYLILSLP
jgi:hypothetical protein